MTDPEGWPHAPSDLPVITGPTFIPDGHDRTVLTDLFHDQLNEKFAPLVAALLSNGDGEDPTDGAALLSGGAGAQNDPPAVALV